MTETMTFYLVRHGEAENNVRHISSSLPEKEKYPLTESGRKKVAETAAYLKQEEADVMFCSPLLRTRQTAEIIAQATGLLFSIDERLHETGMGVFNGKTHEGFMKKYEDPVLRISPDEADGVESFLDMRGRLESFLRDVKKLYSGKKVVVVSHGDPLEQLHGILLHESPGVAARGWYPEKGSCTKVVWEVKKGF